MSTAIARSPDERINWIKSIPFLLVHVLAVGVVFFEFSWKYVALCVGLYYVRMFFLTSTYHRYFAHRSYKMGRVMQFLMAFGAATTAQKGPLWWAGHHRNHHRYSDEERDVHSPKKGFWWSHVGWILCSKYDETPIERIQDFAKFPELRWLNKYHLVPPITLGTAVFLVFGWAGVFYFLLSTVILWHGTFVINSLAHVFGRRRYVTTDTSRNSLILALITCGEGWHNNHHYYQSTTNQGFFWWEIDITYYILRVMSWFGLVKDIRTPSKAVLTRNLIRDGHHDVGLLGAPKEGKGLGLSVASARATVAE